MLLCSKSVALVAAAIMTTCSTLVSAMAYSHSDSVVGSASRLTKRHQLAGRDASTLMSGGKNNEGEAHGPLKAPKGAQINDLNVGKGRDQIAAYWTDKPKNSSATQAFVMIHGKLRNGDGYWTIMDDALNKAVKANFKGADPNSIVIAPQFFSEKYNSGQYSKNELAWADVNAWQAGEIATHPAGTMTSAFDVLDAFVKEFSNTASYPKMRNITLVGHGGGAQLMQRYAVVAKDPPGNVHVRYIFGDPSSCVYFGPERPQVDPSIANVSSCPTYNTWRYGFTNFTNDVDPTSTMGPTDYFAQYIKRDVITMIGLQDVDASGDEYCMAQLQGGSKRRDRNLAYWKYINTLAKTNFDMTGFNATYPTLPDYSNISHNVINHRLIVIEDADHDPSLVFGSAEGRAALFQDDSLPTGWRPQGWSAAGNGQKIGAPSSSSGAAGQSTSKSSSASAVPVASIVSSQALVATFALATVVVGFGLLA